MRIVDLTWIPSLGKFRVGYENGKYEYVTPEILAASFMRAITVKRHDVQSA
jgi:hypothetical protein